jgi:hypothetical protein
MRIVCVCGIFSETQMLANFHIIRYNFSIELRRFLKKKRKLVSSKPVVAKNHNSTALCPLINTQWDGTTSRVGHGRGLWVALPGMGAAGVTTCFMLHPLRPATNV